MNQNDKKEWNMLNLIKLMVAMALASFSFNASAYALADVGTQDTLLAADTLGSSGSATEAAWVEDTLRDLGLLGASESIDYTQFSDTSSEGANWEAVVGGASGDYAFEFDIGFNPEYYLLKVGGGRGAGADATHHLYTNLESLQYAYVNLSDFGEGVSLTNIGIISHVGASGGCEGDCESVPEPGMLGLLAIGLLGMVARRRLKV
jgi:hypothetical protein